MGRSLGGHGQKHRVRDRARRQRMPACASDPPLLQRRHTYISTLLAAGAKPLFVCRQTGTSLEMIEKHYGDARVDAEQLDEMIGELEPPTRNLPGTLPVARDD